MYLTAYFVLLILSLIQLTTSKTDNGNCYVLALEGGGDKGAYQAGAIKGLVENIPAGQREWSVITGISVGSLNAAGLSVFEPGKEEEAIDFIIKTWKDIKGNRDIYDNWWMGPLYGLFYKTGLYDTEPLHKLLAKLLDGRSLKKNLIVGATNIETGLYERFDSDSSSFEDTIYQVLTSTAFPVIFPNIEFKNKNYIDGGVKFSVDIAAGIQKCLDKGYNDTSIYVDVVLCNSKILPQKESSNFHPLQVLIRYLEISGYDNAMKDVDMVIDLFDRVNFRYIVAPTQKLPSGSVPLEFSPVQMNNMIELGISDAKKVTEMGEGVNFKKLNGQYKQETAELYLGVGKNKDKSLTFLG
jgi:predicted patatin/cPLA2 family phospholipase